MITRLTIFIALLSVFYIYCKEDTSPGTIKQPTDLNMLQVPEETDNQPGHLTRNVGKDTVYYQYTILNSDHD